MLRARSLIVIVVLTCLAGSAAFAAAQDPEQGPAKIEPSKIEKPPAAADPAAAAAAPAVDPTAPAIARVVPLSGLWQLLWRRFDMELRGERLPAPTGSDKLQLLLGGDLFRLPPCTPPSPKAEASEKTFVDQGTLVVAPCFWTIDAGTRLSIHGVTSGFGSTHELRLRDAAGHDSGVVKVHVGVITTRSLKVISILVFLMLLLIVARLAPRVRGGVAGNASRMRLASWALLDEQTNTYSLSKLQFLLWLAVVAYAYVYFFLAYVFIQGHGEFPNPPENLLSLLGVTGGTTLGSIFVTRARGAKGSGEAVPALSDLVSSGGVLAPERAQFLVWTIFGCIGYIALILEQSPDTLTALPSLNQQLLTAMGASSLVYVGGKMVRLPGPIINEVKAATDAAAGDVTLTVRGQNMQQDALVSIDQAPAVDVRPQDPVMMQSSVAAGLASELTLKLGKTWQTGDHLLRLTNADGQYAEIWFASDPPEITQVGDDAKKDEVAKGTSAIEIAIKGKNLREGSSVEWLPPGATTPTSIAPAQVTAKLAEQKPDGAGRQDTRQLTLSITPGQAVGAGTISVVSPRGMRASRQLSVK